MTESTALIVCGTSIAVMVAPLLLIALRMGQIKRRTNCIYCVYEIGGTQTGRCPTCGKLRGRQQGFDLTQPNEAKPHHVEPLDEA